MKTSEDLRSLLRSIDHRGYPAYKDTKGQYRFPAYVLSIDHVQGDPFAAPSKVSVHISQERAAFPPEYYDLPHKRVALQDHLTRLFYQRLRGHEERLGSGKSGLVRVSCPRQEILERTACEIGAPRGGAGGVSPGAGAGAGVGAGAGAGVQSGAGTAPKAPSGAGSRPGANAPGALTMRFEVGFPAFGRTINAAGLIQILFDFLPQCVERTLLYKNLDAKGVESVVFLAEDQAEIRRQLDVQGLVAFVADDSVLPRESGISPRPMRGAIPFVSPDSMRVTMQLPHKGTITGMGVKKGITLIVGGGYHGKSTLLSALELGVYDHIAGDGREYVATAPDAMKIRSEDGRGIQKVYISMFINHLPNKKDTRAFTSEDASGSTSQAANVMEAIESGSKLLLIDEDTCATNFMVRDELMQRVVLREQEPITPFIERARYLYERQGISTVLVAGSSGAYFDISDAIVQMDNYVPKDITARAKEEAALSGRRPEGGSQAADSLAAWNPALRCPRPNGHIKNDDRVKMKTLGRDAFMIDHDTVELRYVEQIVDSEQVSALAHIFVYAQKNLMNGKQDLKTIVAQLERLLDQGGPASIAQGNVVPPDLARPRIQEIFACFNRFRGLQL
ncbi:MAG: ABC-ATPase domain-containing protein [Lachnospiraceae bacterium]|jgi:predicted ABC-class ATPase|nr:ABC-ATPase domain-containing protein [Lachnospiraceae bacterium]